MTPDEWVEVLYRGLLGRDPDPAGLAHHRELLSQGATVEAVAGAIKNSPEAERYRRRSVCRHDDAVAAIARMLKEKLVVVDIGAQTLTGEDHVYQPLLDRGLVQAVIGFEPIEEKAQARNGAEPYADIRAVALGSGAEETLYVNNFDATSSLFPINSTIMGITAGLDAYETVRREKINTVRLDDIDTPHRIDLMKLDIQGYELRVLEHAVSTLGKTLVVQCEVEFQEIYQGQPLFGEVFNFLRSNGFVMCDILNQVRLSSRCFSDISSYTSGRLFWGDAVFIKEEVERDADLIRQSIVTSSVYKWPDTSFDLLSRYDSLTGDNLSGQYVAALHGARETEA